MASTGNGNPVVQNRSALKDFIASIATISGDLSNISAPPFVLDTKSTVEIPSYWAENSSIFCSPAKSEDPAERALYVLRSFLSGVKSQCYMGHSENEGLRKPLNSFLGELFLCSWEDENGTTRMVSEQVSHHPPVAACRIWNEKHGVIAESFNRSSVSLSTSVKVESTGIVLKTIQKYDEHYLLPIPSFNVKSLLSTPSPSLSGTYYISSTSGYMSVVEFSEKGLFGSSSQKHSFEAYLYKESDGPDRPLYTIKGNWDSQFTIHDERNKEELETFDVQSQAIDAATPMIIADLDKQDPWESRNAWKHVLSGLERGDMQAVSTAKDKLEEGQRQMRKDEEAAGKSWTPLFFKPVDKDSIIESLAAKIPNSDSREVIIKGETIWMFDEEKWKSTSKPYHGPLQPDNTKGDNTSTVIQQKETKTSSGDADHKGGANEDGRKANQGDVQVDVGPASEIKHTDGATKDQPRPQAAQTSAKEEQVSSGLEGMSLDEKQAVESMLRDQYSTSRSKK